MTRKEYIAQWHSLFTNYVDTTLGVIAARINRTDGNREEKLSNLKLLLEGPDVYDVKSDLCCGIISDRTLDKTETIYAEIGKFFIDITIDDERVKVSLKQLADIYEHYRKEMTKLELSMLK